MFSSISMKFGSMAALVLGTVFALTAPSAQAQSPYNHAAAVAACKQHEANHDAHKKCLHDHHTKAVPAAHHAALNHAFTACHHEKDQAKHSACVDRHHVQHVQHHATHGAHAPAPLHHDAAHHACAAQAKDHNKHKACLYEHHRKTVPAAHQAALSHAFQACHHETDHAKHTACVSHQKVAHVAHHTKHGANARPLLHHAAAHHACGTHASNHDTHKKCLTEHHLKTVPAAHHASLNAAFKACHAEKDHAKHQACVDKQLHT